MARGSKKKYTSKQKRKAHDIEKGYKKRGVSSKEAERRAWATVNKSDRGGRKKAEEVAGKGAVNQFPQRWKKRWSQVERPKARGDRVRTISPRVVIDYRKRSGKFHFDLAR